MVPFQWVDATDLNLWANRRDAQARLPQLLRRLIHATVQQPQRVVFPAGDSVQMPGWDGIVDAPEGNSFVPNGYSVWELGVSKDVNTKADKDYDKRVKNPLGVIPAETTFVFVTLRRWAKKDKWEKEKKSERIWADVRAYDADDLEQWLEQAHGVHAWLAPLMRKWPEEAQDLSSFWDDWKNSTSPAMNTQLHLAGREEEVEKVHNWLKAEPSKLTIQADTREEAIAFFAAVIHQMPEAQNVNYLSRCIIVKNESSLRYFASTQESLILIPAFEQPKLPKEHHILIPIGRDISRPKEGLVLSRPKKTDFRQALVDMGLSEERADKLIKNSKRNLNVLRRLIAVAPEIHTPDWAKPENARSLITVLLAGAWDESKEGDKEVIAKLARKPYKEVEGDILRWVNSSDPPVRQVGSVWQLISREDSWYLLSRFIVPDDLEAFTSITLSVLGTIDGQYELPLNQRFAASIYGKGLPNSDFLRKGLAETLAILATRGLESETQDIMPAQQRVSEIIHQLLNANVDWHMWASLAYLLPTLAEAAPEAFLETVNNGLAGDNPILLQLFLQEEFFVGSSPHTGLLWALEVLVSEPQYLSQVTLILGKLSRLNRGGKNANRPFERLREIFLCWNPQTPANLAQRLRVIDTLIAREPDIAWQLLCNLLPKITDDISHPIYKPRWRDWNEDVTPQVTTSEYWENIDAVMQRLLDNMVNDSKKICDIINKIEPLPAQLQDKTINFLLEVDTINIQPKDLAIICDTLRAIIHKHKKRYNAECALPADVIDKLYLLYQKFEPEEIIYCYTWLFSSNKYNFLYCIHKEDIHRDWETNSKKIKQAQTAAAKKIYFQSNITSILEMAAFVKEPGLLGAAIANIENITEESEISLLYETLGNEENALNAFAIGFIGRRLEKYGWTWAENIINFAKNNDWSEQQVINLFYGLPFEKRTWDSLITFGKELEKLYWQTINIHRVKKDDCEKICVNLLEVNRPYAALNLLVSLYDDEITQLPD
ncbi:hypothetical protein [Moorena producens]|uniref:hypothetical protein n=1 Tax=Moorena producens TaxID=1155739 RepID=UPI003C72B549